MSGVKRDCRCQRVKHVHGTQHAYQSDGCRCDACREACRVAEHQRRKAVAYGRFPHPEHPCGTTRRLQALVALGWNAQQLRVKVGCSRSTMTRLLYGQTERVQARVASSVRAVYDELWDQPPPARTPGERRNVTVVKAHARRLGYLPPLAWDDCDLDNPAASPRVPSGPSAWDLRPCGTPAAYRRHRRRGEQPCQACLAAERRRARGIRGAA